MSIVIGLTGPTGAGKSSLSQVATALGFKVINCDAVARDAVEKGSDGLAALCKAFGDDILLKDGTLDRKALATRAFADREKTQLLNETLLPFISKLVLDEIDAEFVVLDAPTLFESGLDSICFETVAVLAENDVRLNRIMERDGITCEQANMRMSAGKSNEFYIEKANKVFYNNGVKESLISEVKQYLENIIGGSKK